MAILNARQEGYQVTINGVDCTGALNGPQWLNLKEEKFSDSGRFLKTGSISLIPVIAGFAANFFNPRKNAAQWMRGNTVLIDVLFSGTFERLFTGYILSPPSTPSRTDGVLTVEIGCELAFKNKDVLAGDRAGVKLGQPKTRTEILTNIANSINWQGGVDIAIDEYPINYPIPLTSGTPVGQMSAIAASALYGLDCDQQGRLRTSKFTIQPDSYLLEFSDATSFLEPVDGSEDPAGKVEAIAVGRKVEPNGISNEFVSEEAGVLFADSRQTITGIRKRTTLKEQWSPDFKQLVTTETIEKPSFDLTSGTNITLGISSIKKTIKAFSPQIDGKLLTKTTEVTGQSLTATSTELILISREVESWTYDGEVPASKETAFYGLFITASASELRLRKVERVAWQKLAGDRWVRQESRYVPNEEDGSLRDTGETLTEIGERFKPAEPERHIPTDSSEAISYKGVACFGDVSPDEDEPAIYEFDYGHSTEQAEALAELHGAVLVGRHRTWRAKVPFSAEWFNYRPGACARVTLPDGTIIAAMIDGPSFNFSEANGIVGFSLIDLGSVGEIAIARPIGQILDGSEAPPTPPAPIYTPINPPYSRVSTTEAGVIAGAEGTLFVNNYAPSSAEAGVIAGANGLSPVGDAGAEAGVTAGADSGVDTSDPPLSIAQGGTGATTLAGARAALGFGGIAGGALTGTYPNPAIAQSAVNYANIQEVTASRLLGNSLEVAGSIQEIEIGDNLTLDNGVLSASASGGGGGSSGSTTFELAASSTSFVIASSFFKLEKHYRAIFTTTLAASGVVKFYVNSDFSDPNYSTQYLFASSSSRAAARESGAVIGASSGSNPWFVADLTLSTVDGRLTILSDVCRVGSGQISVTKRAAYYELPLTAISDVEIRATQNMSAGTKLIIAEV